MQKKIVIHRAQGNIKVRGEPAYIIDTCIGKTITRRGKHIWQIRPKTALRGYPCECQES